jgi:hypothetical protein
VTTLSFHHTELNCTKEMPLFTLPSIWNYLKIELKVQENKTKYSIAHNPVHMWGGFSPFCFKGQKVKNS